MEPPKISRPGYWVDPDKAKFADLYKYSSRDMKKIQQSVLNYKGSLKYIGGVLAGCFIMKSLVDSAVSDYIFGENGNGGNFLKMYTVNSDSDYAYNREFQRMRYLNEEPAGDDPFTNTRDEQLVDLGYSWTPLGNNPNVQKRSPHFKYF